MPQVRFQFDKEKDNQNLWELCNFSNPWESKDKLSLDLSLEKKWKGKNFKDSSNDIEDYLRVIQNSGYPEIFCECLNKSWEKINKDYFSRLERLTNKSIFAESINGYITTVGRSTNHLYNKSFTVSMHRQILQALRTCGHELLHLQVENYFGKNISNILGEKKFEIINESLTVLLNLEFKDLWFMEDSGYEPHKELRTFISEEWKKEKDFDKLIDRCITRLK